MDLDRVADELYALTPAEFTSARDAAADRARQAGDRPLARQIRSLRKPTTGAWLANLLTRTHPEETAALLKLGRALRSAQEHLAGPELRDLLAQRHQVVLALVDRAREEAGRAGQRIGDGPARELEEILQAALADRTAAADFAAGRLTTALHPGVDATLPTGTGSPRPARARPATERPGRTGDAPTGRTSPAGASGPAAERTRLEAEAADLTARLKQAKLHSRAMERQAAAAQKRADRASAALENAGEAVRRARLALEQAEAAHDTTAEAARAHREEADTATARAQEAESRTAELTGQLEAARRRITDRAAR